MLWQMCSLENTLEYIAFQNISRKGKLFRMFSLKYKLKGKSTSTFYTENCSQTKEDFAICVYSEHKKRGQLVLHLEVSFQTLWKLICDCGWKTEIRPFGTWHISQALAFYYRIFKRPAGLWNAVPNLVAFFPLKPDNWAVRWLRLGASHHPIVAVGSVSRRPLKWGQKCLQAQILWHFLIRKACGLTGPRCPKHRGRKHPSVLPLQLIQGRAALTLK